jgi:hypothetical protein
MDVLESDEMGRFSHAPTTLFEKNHERMYFVTGNRENSCFPTEARWNGVWRHCCWSDCESIMMIVINRFASPVICQYDLLAVFVCSTELRNVLS